MAKSRRALAPILRARLLYLPRLKACVFIIAMTTIMQIGVERLGLGGSFRTVRFKTFLPGHVPRMS
jgi:hypothetical protein